MNTKTLKRANALQTENFEIEENENIENQNEQFDFESFQKGVIEALEAGRPFLGKNGSITPLIKKILEAALEAEIETHISQTKNQENRKNGKTSKLIKSDSGTFELITPRDRDGTFEPKIVKKRQTILNATLDEKILHLFSIGLSLRDIRFHIQEIYGTDISEATISVITDKLIPIIQEWRSRPLETLYPIVFLDAMFFKIKDGQVATKALYNIIGINIQGEKELLGFYLAESEGASFWLSVLNDLKNRGVKDILITCTDGLTGFPEAINTAFPKTEVQLCIIHQIRNSLKCIISKDQKEFMMDLKTVYKAATKELAESNLLKLSDKWNKKYPIVIKSWVDKWDKLSTYFKYSSDIRRIIYTTNTIEAFHRQVRKYTKSKGAFTSENALYKLVYCVCQNIKKKWCMPIPNWGLAISQLDIYFPGRIKIGL